MDTPPPAPVPAAPAASAPRRRRSLWLWILGGLAASVLLVAVAVLHAITLSRDARTLRHAVFAALDTSADTRVQLDAGPLLLGAVRVGVHWIDRVPREARLALSAVRAVSVGVYHPRHPVGADARARIFTAADEAMQRRGWVRVVGVNDHDDTVLIYQPESTRSSGTQRFCLVVCERRQIVIVAATADPGPLIELAAMKGKFACAD